MEYIKKNIESDNNNLKSIRDKILLNWINNCSNQSIKETLIVHKNVKDDLNSTIAHANPIHNLIAWSWSSAFDFEFKEELYIDGWHDQSFSDYFLYISTWLHSLLILIYQIALESNSPYLKLQNLSIFHEIDAKIENLITKGP